MSSYFTDFAQLKSFFDSYHNKLNTFLCSNVYVLYYSL